MEVADRRRHAARRDGELRASLRNQAVKMVAAAELPQEWAEGYSGNGGVAMSGVRPVSAVVFGSTSVSASRMAVMGRHES